MCNMTLFGNNFISCSKETLLNYGVFFPHVFSFWSHSGLAAAFTWMKSCDELWAALKYPGGIFDFRDEAKKADNTNFV